MVLLNVASDFSELSISWTPKIGFSVVQVWHKQTSKCLLCAGLSALPLWIFASLYEHQSGGITYFLSHPWNVAQLKKYFIAQKNMIIPFSGKFRMSGPAPRNADHFQTVRRYLVGCFRVSMECFLSSLECC